MNTTLLILGVFLILLSIILITINSTNSNDERQDYEIKDKMQEQEKSYTTISNFEDNLTKDNNVIDETVEIAKTKDDKELEDEILSRDFRKSENFKQDYLELDKSEENQTNITDEIIKMYKEDGLEVNEIAKKLKKGIREIEIILKVNNVTK